MRGSGGDTDQVHTFVVALDSVIGLTEADAVTLAAPETLFVLMRLIMS
jgi:hypothetical protein